jgi:methyl-accepting chemotaxis protein
MCRELISSVVENLGSAREGLYLLKENLSSVFEDMGSFMLSSSNQLESFLGVVGPYVRYFYPAEINPDCACFLNEVVNPCRIEMDSAMDRAVSIMDGDERITDEVSHAIERVLEIRDQFDRILSVIEVIEIYSVNTILVASKAGREGFPLTRISEEMGKLSEKANRVSTNCRRLVDELDDAFGRFSKLRENIGILNENYLTRMKVQSNMVFNELIGDLNAQSVDVNDILRLASDIEGSIGQVMKWLQIEDIVRQDLEKVIYLDEEVSDGDTVGNLFTSINDPADRTRMFSLVSFLRNKKMRSIGENITPLIDGTSKCCRRVKGILNGFLERFSDTGGAGDGSSDGEQFNMIYRRLEGMKNEFIGYIEKIIDGKRNLYDLSLLVLDIMNSVGIFFADLTGIAKRFETINILTRIELAKQIELRKTMGSALTDVRNLPSKMKGIIDSSALLYREVHKGITASIEDYHVSYKHQEESLRSCIKSMERISAMLIESQRYYRDISEEIGGVCTRVLEHMEDGEKRLNEMASIMNMVHISSTEDGNNEGVEFTDFNNGSISSECIDILRHYLSGSVEGSYRRTVLNSLLSEVRGTVVDSGVVLFQEAGR